MEKNRKIPTFKLVEERVDGNMYQSKTMGLVVIQSVSKEQDGRFWVHTSYSRRRRIPTYEDTVFVKKWFIGEGRKAIMVFPAKSEHVNIHPNALHLFTSLDDDPLPDFTHGLGTL